MTDIETLVVRAAAADEAAWQQLWSAIEPPLTRMIAQPRFLGALGRNEDDRRNIIVAVMGRLRADDFARLTLYLESRRENPRLTFVGWLSVVAKRVGIDYLRAHPAYVRRCGAQRSRPGAWVHETGVPESQLVGARVPVTMRLTARRIVEQAGRGLPTVQRRALELWTHGEDLPDIAREVGLADARAAHRAVRAALDRLRRACRV
jgi:DNA-directed RNA polymerase specialized sigma24 family protein